jgi:hypothetical protein
MVDCRASCCIKTFLTTSFVGRDEEAGVGGNVRESEIVDDSQTHRTLINLKRQQIIRPHRDKSSAIAFPRKKTALKGARVEKENL